MAVILIVYAPGVMPATSVVSKLQTLVAVLKEAVETPAMLVQSSCAPAPVGVEHVYATRHVDGATVNGLKVKVALGALPE